MILVTGGCGFIGSNFILEWLARSDEPVVNLDALTYAGNPANLAPATGDPRLLFARCDIRDADAVRALFRAHRPRAVVHFAAETHVDRSIAGPALFYETNVQGTVNLLEASRGMLERDPALRDVFRFLFVGTDEVYGSLGTDAPPSDEGSPFLPNSPYAASKAAADLAVRAWGKTYGVPVLVTRCSNNYGPRQYPEKLIPLVIARILAGEPIPVYGDGLQVRDWLHVSDHCEALRQVLDKAAPGSVYNIAGTGGMTNIALVRALCRIMDELRPSEEPASRLITFVRDRPAHDTRYALSGAKLARELGVTPATPFETGLRDTVAWYLGHPAWLTAATRGGAYRRWVDSHYGRRPETPA